MLKHLPYHQSPPNGIPHQNEPLKRGFDVRFFFFFFLFFFFVRPKTLLNKQSSYLWFDNSWLTYHVAVMLYIYNWFWWYYQLLWIHVIVNPLASELNQWHWNNHRNWDITLTQTFPPHVMAVCLLRIPRCEEKYRIFTLGLNMLSILDISISLAIWYTCQTQYIKKREVYDML